MAVTRVPGGEDRGQQKVLEPVQSHAAMGAGAGHTFVPAQSPVLADGSEPPEGSGFSRKEETEGGFESSFYFQLRKTIKFQVQKYKRLPNKSGVITVSEATGTHAGAGVAALKRTGTSHDVDAQEASRSSPCAAQTPGTGRAGATGGPPGPFSSQESERGHPPPVLRVAPQSWLQGHGHRVGSRPCPHRCHWGVGGPHWHVLVAEALGKA